MKKLRDLLVFFRLARQVQDSDPQVEMGAAKAAALRGGKGMIAGMIGGAAAVGSAFLIDFVTAQTGSGCVLGPAACSALAIPSVKATIMASTAAVVTGAFLAGEKFLNEKFGLGIQLLDTVTRPALPAPSDAPPAP